MIVGPSDYGKSALVRALRWLFYNEPKGADFIRVGARICRVKVELDEGTEVTRVRDQKRNRYILQKAGEKELTFESFGNEVPHEVVLASGIRKVLIDDRNKVELNFGAQLEGPFLLADSGSVRAKVIGRLGGVHILDWAQKSVVTDLRRGREEENRLASDLGNLEEALRAYDYLPQLEKKIDQLEEVIEEAQGISRKIEVLEGIQLEWVQNGIELEKAEAMIEKLDFLELGEQLISILEEILNNYLDLENLVAELREVEDQLTLAEMVIKKTSLVSTVDEHVKDLEGQKRLVGVLEEAMQELTLIERRLEEIERCVARTENLEAGEKYVLRAFDLVQELRILQDLWNSWQEQESGYQRTCATVERYQKELEKLLQKFRELLINMGKCPVCFGELTQEAVARVLNEYR